MNLYHLVNTIILIILIVRYIKGVDRKPFLFKFCSPFISVSMHCNIKTLILTQCNVVSTSYSYEELL